MEGDVPRPYQTYPPLELAPARELPLPPGCCEHVLVLFSTDQETSSCVSENLTHFLSSFQTWFHRVHFCPGWKALNECLNIYADPSGGGGGDAAVPVEKPAPADKAASADVRGAAAAPGRVRPEVERHRRIREQQQREAEGSSAVDAVDQTSRETSPSKEPESKTPAAPKPVSMAEKKAAQVKAKPGQRHMPSVTVWNLNYAVSVDATQLAAFLTMDLNQTMWKPRRVSDGHYEPLFMRRVPMIVGAVPTKPGAATSQALNAVLTDRVAPREVNRLFDVDSQLDLPEGVALSPTEEGKLVAIYEPNDESPHRFFECNYLALAFFRLNSAALEQWHRRGNVVKSLFTGVTRDKTLQEVYADCSLKLQTAGIRMACMSAFDVFYCNKGQVCAGNIARTLHYGYEYSLPAFEQQEEDWQEAAKGKAELTAAEPAAVPAATAPAHDDRVVQLQNVVADLQDQVRLLGTHTPSRERSVTTVLREQSRTAARGQRGSSSEREPVPPSKGTRVASSWRNRLFS